MIMNISAMTAAETETMLKIIDKWIRFHFNSFGAHRRASWNRKANDGIRAQIRVDLPEEQWDYIGNGACFEMARVLGKSISTEDAFGVLDLSTEEATI